MTQDTARITDPLTRQTWRGVTLVSGETGAAPVCALDEPLSFWGGFDAPSGRITDRAHPQVGQSLAGVVLVMSAGRGSSGGSSVLAEALHARTGPCGIILRERDAIVTLGAIVATRLYPLTCPVVVVAPNDWQALKAISALSISA